MTEKFRTMRRQDRALPPEEAERLLSLAKWGTLSLAPGDDGYPHAIPINCAFVDGALLFHCAYEGKKLDILDRDDRACFSAVLSSTLVPDGLTMHYQSVVCYGRVKRIDEAEKLRALTDFTAGVFGAGRESVQAKIGACARNTLMLRMEIEHMTGKRNGPAAAQKNT